MSIDTNDFDEASRDIQPSSGPYVPSTAPTHLDAVRAHLAYGIIILVAVLYIAIVIAAICGWIDHEMTQSLLTGIGFPAGLASAVAGFYFGKER